MPVTSVDSSVLVIDASAAIWALLPAWAAQGVDITRRFSAWRQLGLQLVAPMLWLAECTSAIRGGVYARAISADEGQTALDDLFSLEVEAIALTPELCREALGWAGRLGQSKAYDGFYLALAENLGAEFWTADRRLANGARQLGMLWAHWIGEETT